MIEPQCMNDTSRQKTEDVEAWIQSFGGGAKFGLWSDKDKGETFPVKLIDETLRYWETIDPDPQYDYPVCRKILIAYRKILTPVIRSSANRPQRFSQPHRLQIRAENAQKIKKLNDPTRVSLGVSMYGRRRFITQNF